MMRMILLLTVLFGSVYLNAQQVSKDSISILKVKKERALLRASLNDKKIKLANLENSLISKKQSEEKARTNAQQSADANSKIASDLSSNADSKKYARRAKKAAKRAKKDGRTLRKATAGLESLQNDIESTRTKIADDEKKLQSMDSNL